jgi:hypothetical protein
MGDEVRSPRSYAGGTGPGLIRVSAKHYVEVSGGAGRRVWGDGTGAGWVSEKNSTRKLAEQSSLSYAPVLVGMRQYPARKKLEAESQKPPDEEDDSTQFL